MAAYLVADVDITDADGYQEYASGVPASIEAYGGRYLVRAGRTQTLEGKWVPKRFVILEFPDMDKLKAWYDSPEYVPLRDIRHRCADTNLIVADGV